MCIYHFFGQIIMDPSRVMTLYACFIYPKFTILCFYGGCLNLPYLTLTEKNPIFLFEYFNKSTLNAMKEKK